ncbi:MAG: DUF1501 domain-containing protein [Planctomycetota bacterium]
MTDWTRRAFLHAGAAAAIAGRLVGAEPRAAVRRSITPRADAVIQIHLAGGLSHIDTFDPKPEAPVEVRGPFAAIKTNVNGLRLSSLLPRTAAVADKLTLIRSMTHTEADHDRGSHSVLTGYAPSPAIVYPSFGAVVAHELGGRNDLPAYVCVPQANSGFLANGYLGSAFAPFAIGGNPGSGRFKVRDLAPPEAVDEARRERRKQMLHDLDADRPELQTAGSVVASEAFYQQAWKLLESPTARTAFDLAAEPDAKKDRYGRNTLGMSVLLARRLVQAGSRYVVAAHNGYDHHARIGNDLPARMAEFDLAFSALLEDLEKEGLLDRTLVLVTSEFGRTPRLNADSGRDHWARAFTVAMAGAGIKRGHVHGETNATGAEPESMPVKPADLAATVFAQLGIDPEKKLMSPSDRPIDLVRDGAVIDGVLS